LLDGTSGEYARDASRPFDNSISSNPTIYTITNGNDAIGLCRAPERRRLAAALTIAALFGSAGMAIADDWPGYERLSREQLIAALADSSPKHPAELTAKNLSGLDLAKVDFKGANLRASVLNHSNLQGANLSGCNLTVSFGEGADFKQADLRGAELFSVQFSGADLRGTNLAGARVIGDLKRARLDGAILRNLRGAADMRNQSMGLMNARFNSATLDGADLTGADVSRADFSFAHLARAHFVGAKVVRGDFSGADLSGADLSNADFSESTFIDTDFTSAKLDGARFDGATWRGVRGLTGSAVRYAIGIPPDVSER
jgi:uncharacterized protein YjbI with pentapeptide repeats